MLSERQKKGKAQRHIPPDLPMIGVMPSKIWKGVNDPLVDKAYPLEIKTWHQAFNKTWKVDAHFVTYQLINNSTDKWPRFNKASLQGVRDAGADLVATMMVFDYDNPGHAPWTQDMISAFMTKVTSLEHVFPLAMKWTALYTTRHGARFIYVLTEGIPVDVAEGHHIWMVEQFRSHGIELDKGCSDWTRVFRLPKVVRDGSKSWRDKSFCLIEELENKISPDDMGHLDRKPKPKVAPRAIFKYKPEDAHLKTRVFELTDRGQIRRTEWTKEAHKRLKGRHCYDCLFRNVPLAAQGERNNTLIQYVGEAVSLTFGIKHEDGTQITTPEHIYELFLDTVEQLEPDPSTPDWSDVLWRHILYCWSQEIAEVESVIKEKEERQSDSLFKLDRIIDTMRSWCSAQPLHSGTDIEAREYALDHLIACTPRGCYVMTPEGYYDGMCVSKDLLIPRIKSVGMQDVIQTRVPTETGSRAVGGQELLNTYGTVIGSVRGEPELPGNYVADMDHHTSTMVLSLYERRKDLTPTFDPQVDEWLRKFGGDRFDDLCNWVGWALAPELGPIAAISFCGYPAAGKKMFSQGLAECFTHGTMATARDLVGNFNGGLMKSPILFIDEGWPTQHNKHPADVFRELVAGGANYVNRKFQEPVLIFNPIRVVFAANNMGVVRFLGGNRDLSPEDTAALAQRLLHFDIGDRASKWLRDMGGARYTTGWIKGDGNIPSKFTVAKHFLWLYENMRQPPDGRLLVEGVNDFDLMRQLRTQSGSAPLVIETILKMVESKGSIPGMVVENGKLYCLSSEILTYFRTNLSKDTREQLNLRKIGTVLKGITLSSKPRVVSSRSGIGRRRWYELDARSLLATAISDGWPHKKLAAIVEKQEKNG